MYSNRSCQFCNTIYNAHFNSKFCSSKCRQKNWDNNNVERRRELQRKWRKANPKSVEQDKVSESHRRAVKKWVEKNKDRKRAYNNAYDIKRKSVDILYRLSSNLRSRMSHAITGRKGWPSAIRHLGCTVEELRKYLESKFQPGMTWNNYGHKGWHIDHIIPLSNFDLSDPEQFKKACHYTNLQPLWAADNLAKGAKLEDPTYR